MGLIGEDLHLDRLSGGVQNLLEVLGEAAAVGAAPIRVRLPLDGKLFKLEKILVLPGDELVIRVQYRDWKVPQ